MSDNGANVGIMVSVATIIGTVIAFLTFWTRLTDKISDADKKAEIADKKAADALQEAAEAKNETARLREAIDEMVREMHDQFERVRRENGESLIAIRQHITEAAFFMRDNFVRNKDFDATVVSIDKRLGDIVAQMRAIQK